MLFWSLPYKQSLLYLLPTLLFLAFLYAKKSDRVRQVTTALHTLVITDIIVGGLLKLVEHPSWTVRETGMLALILLLGFICLAPAAVIWLDKMLDRFTRWAIPDPPQRGYKD